MNANDLLDNIYPVPEYLVGSDGFVHEVVNIPDAGNNSYQALFTTIALCGLNTFKYPEQNPLWGENNITRKLDCHKCIKLSKCNKVLNE